MTDKKFSLNRRQVLQAGTAAAAVSMFNINHAWSQDITYDGDVFDAEGAVLRVANWGGTWGELLQTHLIKPFERDFNCRVEYDVSSPWFPKFVANGPENPPLDVANWNNADLYKTAKAGDYLLSVEEIKENVPNAANLWPFATLNGLGITWAFGQYGYAYRTDLADPAPVAFKDFWAEQFAGRRGTYIATNELQTVFFLMACHVFGGNELNYEEGLRALKNGAPLKISDFTGSMNSMMERGEVAIAVQSDAEPMRAKSKGLPIDFAHWQELKPYLPQNSTISRYSPPAQKKLAHAFVNRQLTPEVLKPLGEMFFLRPTIQNMELPQNLVDAGVTNSAAAVDGFWNPDWNAYLEQEEDLIERMNEIFSA